MEETPIEPVIDTTATGPMPEPEVIPEQYFFTEPEVIPVPEVIPEQYFPSEPLPPPPEPSPYITTIDELVSMQGAIIRKEIDDIATLTNLFQPQPAALKLALVNWASQGFPANWVVNTAQINPSVVCSDSQTRGFYEYVLFLVKSPIQPFLDALNAQVPGVTFNFFLRDTNTIGLNVSRA
jgi:hypothetical protein